uniref:Uncharacterized protein n=1 Tax=Amorphochlora amoebiformis TaxID=1561963 RepID=A0A7S0D445_9EUKA|mmetsp:Transcript_18880/g.30033  ORF Transcript_18880/g.30033 Transcript_18880/m.30033 type:complete len:383 (+) Transcript_18880:41-1189(+)
MTKCLLWNLLKTPLSTPQRKKGIFLTLKGIQERLNENTDRSNMYFAEVERILDARKQIPLRDTTLQHQNNWKYPQNSDFSQMAQTLIKGMKTYLDGYDDLSPPILDIMSNYEPIMQILVASIPPKSTVLELGIGSGAVASVVQRVLSDPSQHIAIEPFPGTYGKGLSFLTRIVFPNFQFRLKTGILGNISSAQPIRIGNVTKQPYEVTLNSLASLEKLTTRPFSAIIADCNGAFPEILMENPRLLETSRWIVVKHDHGPERAKRVVHMLRDHGFSLTFGMAAESWGYDEKFGVFYEEIWEKKSNHEDVTRGDLEAESEERILEQDAERIRADAFEANMQPVGVRSVQDLDKGVDEIDEEDWKRVSRIPGGAINDDFDSFGLN